MKLKPLKSDSSAPKRAPLRLIGITCTITQNGTVHEIISYANPRSRSALTAGAIFNFKGKSIEKNHAILTVFAEAILFLDVVAHAGRVPRTPAGGVV